MSRLALLLSCLGGIGAAAACWGEDDGNPQAQGLDIGQTIHAIHDLVATPPKGDKPWSEDIAYLSGDDPEEQQRAIGHLIMFGPPVLPDLAVLGRDRDPLLRLRVVEVAAGVGGAAAAPLLLALSHDQDLRIQENATLGLGRCAGPGVFERLVELHVALEAELRRDAAIAMGGLGDIRALAILSTLSLEPDDLVKNAESDTMLRLAGQEAAVMPLAALISQTSDVQRTILIQASMALADPRLCPVLVASLSDQQPLTVRFIAAQSLATNGDSRAWQVLCAMAAEDPHESLREQASTTMRSLTGFPGSGEGWQVWWQNNAALAARLGPRDELFASLHDSSLPVPRARLAQFPIEDLSPLLDAVLGGGAPWWPARAWQVILADQPGRWTRLMLDRLLATGDSNARLALIILIDQLGGPDCRAALAAITTDIDTRCAREEKSADDGKAVPDRDAERTALRVAWQRHPPAP